MKDFDNLYIEIDIADKKYDILCFTFLPVKNIIDFYDNINNVEQFVRQSLYLIHLTLKEPRQFNSLKTGLTFDDLYQFMEQWVKNSIYYNEWLKGNIDDDGNVKQSVRLKTALQAVILMLEAKEVDDEKEHILFIEMFTDIIKQHAKKYNNITDKKKIKNIKIEVD